MHKFGKIECEISHNRKRGDPLRKEKARKSSFSHRQIILWSCLGALLLIILIFVILLACGVFRDKDENTAPVRSGSEISVPREIENQKTGGTMRYTYSLHEKALNIHVNGNVEAPFCFPFLPNTNTVHQNLSFIAFNCFDYSPAIILSFSTMILSRKIESVHFDGSMNWDPITYRFQVDDSRRVSQCQVEQNGSTTNLVFDYDSNGRLLSVGDPKNGFSFDITYRPDSGDANANSSTFEVNILNRNTAIPNHLTFNANGQLTSLRYRGIQTGKTISASFTYHRNGMIQTENVVHIENRFSYTPSGLLNHPRYNGNSIIIDYTKI